MGWSYLPHTDNDRKAMLAAIGVAATDDLFQDVPANLRLNRPLDLPPALSEPELIKNLQALAKANISMEDAVCFLGAGAYDHFIPSVIDHIIRRSEFYTAYTQYQPEIAQGYLQALWEFQSLICEITGMAVANASMYDGGTAVAEAAMMACAASGRNKVITAAAVHPHYRNILESYGLDRGFISSEAGFVDGVTDRDQLEKMLDDSTAAVIIQSPNFFGSIEDIKTLAQIAHARGAYLITVVDPISLGLLESPGALGVDIVVGEGQGLGLALAYGGPYLGFFAATEKLMRKLPGRIVGQTQDHAGNRGFVLTLQAREQHIRREKATSNICSNQALCALTAAIYLSTVGKQGFREVASQCVQKANYAYRELQKLNGCEVVFSAPFFKEFVVRLSKPVAKVNKALRAKGIVGGLDLGSYYPGMDNCMLLCVTEKRSKAEIDRLVSEMGAIL
ncbi:glycine dehydrogenase [Anaerosporomusa subterranea]|uniref:Probable glycine dehydrogenase (decarboxylating) subunit 1 n=1 Tax=Anaerosporomusa subterranea TaxID=1794912 RepID=A0A154BPP2_ANASB|nr:aminomethyl-transferring glycine dehydrogenase subunit GcvPA [Anaerosporomusa subterranea]KYZ75865.1 glycine dehydrogenase [Anaerosporomusa subterranea]